MTDERKDSSKQEASKSDWNDALAAAVAETSVRKQGDAKSPSALRRLVPILAVMMVIMAATHVNRSRLADLQEERVAEGAATKLLLAAGAIEDHVRKTGMLPDSLGDVRIDRMKVEYIKVGSNAYELRADAGHKTLVYRSDHRFVEDLDSSAARGT